LGAVNTFGTDRTYIYVRGKPGDIYCIYVPDENLRLALGVNQRAILLA